ncbi:MAG: glycosyltransferase family 4 protein [Cyanobacteria bacterium]|nr:glycosyltransferase family 4 protein [Cyanobacteriota bacterium]
MTGAVDSRIAVLTHFPSPYQVELFNEIERQRPGCLRVYYLFRKVASRRWAGVPIAHDHVHLEETPVATIRNAFEQAPFVVFNYYNDARAAQLIRFRERTGRPWCFWGEKPGYRFPWLARFARIGRLASLRSLDHPIWGIGRWAVDAYREEFGEDRKYLNLPYYSNLSRFEISRPVFNSNPVTFLCSGSLSHRKGVDLLATAFLRLVHRHPNVRLKLMGEGPMAPRLRREFAATDAVEWVGFKDWDELPAVYASAQFLCVPSRHDGWGLVVPEGLASGLPTIATNRTGAALDLIETHRNGWLVPAEDADALYRAMAQAATVSETDWRAMSRHGRASVADHSLSRGASRFLHGVDAAVPAMEGVR